MWNSVKATDKEVETALIAEAKKRGFKEGVEYIAVGACSGSYFTLKGEVKFYLDQLSAVDCGGMFANGKWATIAEPKPIAEYPPKPTYENLCLAFEKLGDQINKLRNQ